MTAAELKKSTDALNASIERFLAGMDAMQANLDRAAAEHDALVKRVAELKQRLADSGK